MVQKAIMAVLRAKGHEVSLEELELEPPGPSEALVEIQASGICATDLHYLDLERPLPYPLVCGHEGAGVVRAVGPGVLHVKVGDHVALSMASCQVCTLCLSGQPFYCDHTFSLNFSFKRADGTTPARRGEELVNTRFFGQSSFATHTIADATSLIHIPEDFDFHLAGPLGCGIQTGAGAVINVLRPLPGDSLVVFGAGAVGLSAIMAAKLTGAWPIIAVDVLPHRLALAESLGASHVINSAMVDDVGAAIRAIVPRLDFAVEATSNHVVLTQAFEALGPSGTMVSVGVHGGVMSLNVFGLLGGKKLKMVRMGDGSPQLNIERLIKLQKRGVFPVERLISCYPFKHIADALADMRSGKVIKPVLLMKASGA